METQSLVTTLMLFIDYLDEMNMLIIVRSYNSFLEVVDSRLQHTTFHIMTSNHQSTYHHTHKLTTTLVWIAFFARTEFDSDINNSTPHPGGTHPQFRYGLSIIMTLTVIEDLSLWPVIIPWPATRILAFWIDLYETRSVMTLKTLTSCKLSSYDWSSKQTKNENSRSGPFTT